MLVQKKTKTAFLVMMKILFSLIYLLTQFSLKTVLNFIVAVYCCYDCDSWKFSRCESFCLSFREYCLLHLLSLESPKIAFIVTNSFISSLMIFHTQPEEMKTKAFGHINTTKLVDRQQRKRLDGSWSSIHNTWMVWHKDQTLCTLCLHFSGWNVVILSKWNY